MKSLQIEYQPLNGQARKPKPDVIKGFRSWFWSEDGLFLTVEDSAGLFHSVPYHSIFKIYEFFDKAGPTNVTCIKGTK